MWQMDMIGVHIVRDGLRQGVVCHFDFDERFNVRRIGIVTEHIAHGVGVRTDDGNRFVCLFERQRAVIFQKNHRFLRNFTRSRTVFVGVKRCRSHIRIDERIFKQAKFEFELQNVAHGLIQQLHVDFSLAYPIKQGLGCTVCVGQFRINTGRKCLRDRIRFVFDEMMVAVQLRNGEVVGYNDAAKVPLVTKCITQKCF